MSGLFERILLLKQSTLFSAVSTEDLQSIAIAMEEEQFFKDDKIFEQDHYGEHLYIIQEGEVGISLENNSPEFIETLGKGEDFGVMSLLDDQSRIGTAMALQDTKLLSLEKSKLHGLILHYPELSIGMLKCISLKLRNAILTSNNNE